MKNMRNIVETRNFDNLEITTNKSDVFNVELAATASEELELKRGTVLALNADGKCVVLSANSAGAKANAILAEDITTSKTATVVAVAYRKGHFNRNALITGGEYELSASDEEDLRTKGIYLETEI